MDPTELCFLSGSGCLEVGVGVEQLLVVVGGGIDFGPETLLSLSKVSPSGSSLIMAPPPPKPTGGWSGGGGGDDGESATTLCCKLRKKVTGPKCAW